MEAAMIKRPNFNYKITWKAYFLNPNAPEGIPIYEYLEKVYGRRFDPNKKSPIDTAGDSVGIKFNPDRRTLNTLTSHRLVDYAAKFGKQNEMINEIFRIYFEEAKNINNIDVLVEAADKVGVPKAREYLQTDEGAKEIKEQDNYAKYELAVEGVPFFIIGKEGKEEKLAFSGAQPSELFLKAFDKITNN